MLEMVNDRSLGISTYPGMKLSHKDKYFDFEIFSETPTKWITRMTTTSFPWNFSLRDKYTEKIMLGNEVGMSKLVAPVVGQLKEMKKSYWSCF